MINLYQPLQVADYVALAIYFMLMGLMTLYAYRKVRTDGTTEGVFLGGRSMNWFLIGMSLFVSNIGSEHLIGLAGSGASSGIAVSAYELNALLILQLLGQVFTPVYLSAKVTTLPEYIQKRFGSSRLPITFSIISMLLYVMTKISVNLYSGSIFIEMALGWNTYAAVTLLLCLTALMTMAGGLTAVMYTDGVQACIMVGGCATLTIMSLVDTDTWTPSIFKQEYLAAVVNVTKLELESDFTDLNTTCISTPTEKSFKLLRSNDDPEMPWLPFIIGQTASSVWYWCTDQVIVQRTLSAKNLAHSQAGSLFAGLLKLLPPVLMVLPGMLARIKFPDELGCIPGQHCQSICGEAASCANMAFPMLVLRVLPAGLRGLMFSVIIAALMSGLDSIFNSAATLFTIDIWNHFKPKSSQRQQIWVGRVVVLVLTVLSILWIPLVKNHGSGRLFYYVNEVTNHFSPAIGAVFMLAILWTRLTESGAFWGTIAGFAAGLVRLILLYIYPSAPCEYVYRPWLLTHVHYMTYTAFLFFLTIIVAVVISLFTDDNANIQGLTYWTRYQPLEEEKVKPTFEEEELVQPAKHVLYISNKHRLLLNSGTILLCILGVFAYVYFSI